MPVYDLDSRRLYAREYTERLRRDAQPGSPHLSRRRQPERELRLLSAAGRLRASLRPSN
jgi:hypothetical protein